MSNEQRHDQRGFVRTDDGLQLFYRVHGRGDPAMVCCNGLGVSTFFWHYLVDTFRDRHRVVLWDYRGHGRSQVPGPFPDYTVPRLARDLWTTIDHVGVKRPILLGHSLGVQVILEAYRQRPESVAGLVPILGTYRRPLDTFYDFRYSRRLFDALIALSGSSAGPWLERWMWQPALALPIAWNIAAKANMVDGSRVDRSELRRYLHHLVDIGLNTFMRTASQIADHDATDVLPTIRVPTLIVAAEHDTFTPIAASYHMRDTIEGAELLFLEGATHAGIVERPEVIYPRIEQWLLDHFAGPTGDDEGTPRPRRKRGKPRSRRRGRST